MITGIIESKMIFGFYPAENCFRIENSPLIKKINKKARQGDGVKTAEFILIETKNNKDKIFIVEAKTNPPPVDEKQPRLKDFIEDIKQKLSNSLALFIAIYLDRHPSNTIELSENFKQLDLSQVDFILVLVIKNCTKVQAQKIQESLQKALKQTIKIWNLSLNPRIPSVIVLNEQKAINLGLIYQP